MVLVLQRIIEGVMRFESKIKNTVGNVNVGWKKGKEIIICMFLLAGQKFKH